MPWNTRVHFKQTAHYTSWIKETILFKITHQKLGIAYSLLKSLLIPDVLSYCKAVFCLSATQRKWRNPCCHHDKSCRRKVLILNSVFLISPVVYAEIWILNPKPLLHPAQSKSMQNSSCTVSDSWMELEVKLTCMNRSVPVTRLTPITL